MTELAPDVVETVVVVAAVVVDVVAGEADLPPLQAVTASPTQTITEIRRQARLIVRREGITVQATSASGCQGGPASPPRSSRERLILRVSSQRACSTRSGALSSRQSRHRSDAVRRRGSGSSPPQARQMKWPWLSIDHLLV
jgi:hypothetical protein